MTTARQGKAKNTSKRSSRQKTRGRKEMADEIIPMDIDKGIDIWYQIEGRAAMLIKDFTGEHVIQLLEAVMDKSRLDYPVDMLHLYVKRESEDNLTSLLQLEEELGRNETLDFKQLLEYYGIWRKNPIVVGLPGDLRRIFPHLIKKHYIEELARNLALIWENKLPTLQPITTSSDPYINLKKEPSFFKACLPIDFFGKNIDLCLPAYIGEDRTMYVNPLHDNSQFKEIVTLLHERIDKGRGQDVVVLAGVSGGGKTLAMFAVAAERWAVYLDCSHTISFYGNLMYTELSKIREFPPTLNDSGSQWKALYTLDLALLSRGLLLIMMFIQKKVSSPKDWLFIQLQATNNGLAKIIRVISVVLSKQNLGLQTIQILLDAVNTCLDIKDLLLIYDEAQLLCRPEYGQYMGSSKAGVTWNLLQAYTHRVLGGFPITLLLAGTSMHLAGGLSLVTSVGKYGGVHEVQVILKLPFLTSKEVLQNLDAVINLQGVTDSTRDYLGMMLQGRPRGCASFITLLAKMRSMGESKEQEILNLIKNWYKDMCAGMAEYLKKTCEILGDKIDAHQAILDVVGLRVSSNPNYKHAIALLQHGILPSKEPAYITLSNSKSNSCSQNVEIYTTLESFLLTSIELFLKDRGNTLVDTLVDIMARLQHIKSIGNQLDSAFATAIIQKHGCNVRKELALWTDDKSFVFPDWITPKLKFVTTSNLANSISLVDYIKDVFSKTPNYHCYAMQPEEFAGSDIVLSLVDDKQHVVLMSVTCTISGENIKKGKIIEQALKANLKYQYMVTTNKRSSCKKPNLVIPIDKLNDEHNEDDDDDIDDSTVADNNDIIVANNNNFIIDENFDLDYINTAKQFEVSKNNKLLHEWLLSQTLQHYIHVLVELPRRVKLHGTSKRPEVFRFNNDGDLIIIIDDRNVEQVFGEKMKNLVKSIKDGRKYN